MTLGPATVYTTISSPTNDVLEQSKLSVVFRLSAPNKPMSTADVSRQLRQLPLSQHFAEEVQCTLANTRTIKPSQSHYDSTMPFVHNNSIQVMHCDCLSRGDKSDYRAVTGALNVHAHDTVYPTKIQALSLQGNNVTDSGCNVSIHVLIAPHRDSHNGTHYATHFLQRGNQVVCLDKVDPLRNVGTIIRPPTTHVSHRDNRFLTKQLHYRAMANASIKASGFSEWRKLDDVCMWTSTVGSDQKTEFKTLFFFFH